MARSILSFAASARVFWHGRLARATWLALLLAAWMAHPRAAGSWATETSLPTATQEVSVTALNGLVYVAGGSVNQVRTNAVWAFDPVQHTWASRAAYPGTARDHIGIAVVNGLLYLMGGATAWPQPSVTTVQRYDPSTNSWTAVASLPTARAAMGIAVINGKIYAAGGLTGGISVKDFTVYDPALNTWTALPAMPTSRDHLTGAVLNGKFYAIGGRNGNTCAPVTTVEIYDPATNAWSTGTPMLNPRGGHATGTANGRIQVFGGEGAPGTCGVIASAEELDPVTNTWSALPNMPTPRHGTSGATINNSIYIPGGGTGTGDAATAAHERFDATTTSTLAGPWADTDIGPVGLAGSASFSNGTFTVRGAGADIWGTADSFHFLYQPLNGDGQIVARVASLQNTHTFAKAGVMIRESLDPGSEQAILDVKPGGGLEFMARSTTGGAVSFIASATGSAPVWVRLARSASTLTASTSSNGSTWTTIGTTTVPFAQNVYIGLAVCSHSTSTLNTATFDNVSVTAPGGADAPPTVSMTSPANGSTFTAPATIPLAATASDIDATPVARVDFFANSALVGSDTTSPYTFSWTNVPAGPYTLTAVAVDTANLSATSGAVNVTVGGGGSGALPAPWVDQDVGSVGLAGSATFGNGTFTVKGAGADIWGTADAFNYVYQPLNGDGQITARVTGIQNTNTFAKAGVMIRASLAANAAHALLDVKPNGGGLEFMSRPSTGAATSFIAGSASAVPVWIRIARSGSTFTASASTNGTSWTVLGSTTIAMGTSAYVGLAVTSHTTSTLNQSTFDNVTLGAAPPPPPGNLNFAPKALAVGGAASGTAVGITGFIGPTSLQLGPDGNLYVSITNGKLFVLTLDQTGLTQPGVVTVTSVQEIDDIYLHPSLTCNINNDPFNCQQLSSTGSGRQVTGILIDPASTAGNIVLYVSNSNLGQAATDITIYTYSGTITRLVLQPDPANPGKKKVVSNQDLVVGLPRSREAHSINGMSIGPDGWLYLSAGGHTNAGQPSNFFANLPEYYLSASVVRLNLGALPATLPIDVTNVTSASDLTPLQGKFELFATGYRNGYDLTWHSNGRLYLNGNAANQSQGNTPGSSDGCSTPSISPGDQPDTLNLVTRGVYGGHPNPARQECVWGAGTIYTPDLPPLATFVPPLATYVNGSSTDGIVEYKSDAFGGALKGNLISATYAGDQNLRRVILSPDGASVVQVQNLGAFVNPLDVWADATGNLYVAEYGANRITMLIPSQLGSCPVPNSNPNVTDSDGDGYTDADEQANGTDPCSAASKPPDFDQDLVSDLSDTDDDGDGVADVQDQLYFDAQNGAATSIPLAFNWDPADGAYGKVANSGFTGVQISTNAAEDQASGHALVAANLHAGDAGGHLNVITNSGTAVGSANSQVNALQVGFDSSSSFRVWSRITQPFTGVTPAAGHVGGIFFGPNEDNVARLAIVGAANGGVALQLLVEVGGVTTETARLDITGTPLSDLDLFIVGNSGSHTLAAYYDLNVTGTMTPLGQAVSVPASWFGNNLGAAANTSLAGIMVSHGGAAQTAFGYDFFRIDRTVTPPPPPTGAPGVPSNPSPTNGAPNVSLAASLSWAPSANATSYDVAFGPSNPPPLVSSNQTAASYQPAPLAASTQYYWQVTAKGAGGTTAGPVWTFNTGQSTSATEVVLYASDIPQSGLHGAWAFAADATAAASVKLATPDNGVSQLNNPLASPTHYVEVGFNAVAGVPYRIWLRLRALNNNKFNDSLWVQFSDARVNGSAAYAINTTSGLLVNLATSGTGSSLSAWGWQNTAYWLSQPTTVTFPTTGSHTLRIQVREDGAAFDQIVLSPQAYLNNAPGLVSNDTTIVPKQ